MDVRKLKNNKSNRLILLFLNKYLDLIKDRALNDS